MLKIFHLNRGIVFITEACLEMQKINTNEQSTVYVLEPDTYEIIEVSREMLTFKL